jgi:hypothetical protein
MYCDFQDDRQEVLMEQVRRADSKAEKGGPRTDFTMVWGRQELASKLLHMSRIRSRCGL